MTSDDVSKNISYKTIIDISSKPNNLEEQQFIVIIQHNNSFRRN